MLHSITRYSLVGLIALGATVSQAAETRSIGTLRNNRTGVKSTRLLDGRVLVAGGFGKSGEIQQSLNSAEILYPSYGVSYTTSNMNESRDRHVLVTLASGKVLAAGGWHRVVTSDTSHPPALPIMHQSAEVFDPATGRWRQVGNLIQLGGTSLSAVALPDGRALVAGQSNGATRIEVYNPSTATFTLLAEFQPARNEPVLTLLGNGKVLITGHDSENFPAQVLNPQNGTVMQVGAMAALRTRNYTTTRLRNGGVLVVGGDDDVQAPGTIEYFDPVGGQFRLLASMSTDREHHTTTLLPNGNVVIVGGYGRTNRVPMVTDPKLHLQQPPFAVDGWIGNLQVFNPYEERFVEYSPLFTNQYQTIGLKQQRGRHGAVATPGGNVVFFGGENGSTLDSIEAGFLAK